jgi:cytochrome c553
MSDGERWRTVRVGGSNPGAGFGGLYWCSIQMAFPRNSRTRANTRCRRCHGAGDVKEELCIQPMAGRSQQR